MIGETGQNLSVLILTETGKDWETFGTWYSLNKNLPDAEVVIACKRQAPTPFRLYQWARRLKLKLVYYNQTENDQIANRLNVLHNVVNTKLTNNNILIVQPLIMAIDCLDEKTRSLMEANWINEDVWFLRNPNVAEMLNKYLMHESKIQYDEQPICIEAKESDHLTCLVSYKKGCGKWIDTLRGCPFSNAAGLATTSMTANENRIIELWKKMCSLYSALT
jgi:hypothetical protein